MDLVDLGAVKLDPKTNALLVQAKGMKVSADEDAPDYGAVPVMSCLGVTSFPFPANENGGAQGIVAQVAGLDGVLIGARDTRTAKMVGRGQPGDTIVHSTGPEQAAQLQLKEKKRQAVLITKGSDGKTIAVVLDGKNDKVQIAAFGCMFEMTPDGMSMSAGGASILLQDGKVCLLGNIVLGGMTPTANVQMSPAPVVGTAGASAPAPGVYVGV